ncbi:alpha-galactosidase [Saccharospirillum sp. MSK14-1]|uniref:alpha-galactosidase n=1 Tax=Saccharospirillum sp. MSK14-1 TaxID=1897632 RepID=UPI001304ED03|nr:alpha-galactosidase [Saccharospirillum sp. MSK14-1]
MTLYTLHSRNASVVIEQPQNGAPILRYWGAPLSTTPDQQLWQRALAQAGLDEHSALSVVPTLADGTFMEPALRCHVEGRHWAPQWHCQCLSADDQQLTFQLQAVNFQVQIDWQLQLDTDTDVLSIDVRLTNLGPEPLSLEQWLTTLPLPLSMTEVMSFSGRWVHEFQPQRDRLPLGSLEYTNLRGRTSHDHFPGLLVSDREFSPDDGEVYGFHLGWSGNHRQRLERSQLGHSQYQAGAHLLPGEVSLSAGEQFDAPTLYACRSKAGYNGIAERFQRFVRAHILQLPGDAVRPVHINTWEALYFDHNQHGLDQLAEAGARVGAERYVLDDGWFLGRRDDSAGLGDWVVDPDIYPEQLHPLAATLKQHGLEFGLWVEPEMVNPRSRLYEQHPDWVLAIDGQHQPLARNQRVLDLTRTEVRDYLFDHLNALLSDYPIRYLKWDMNRDHVQAADADGRAAGFRQTQGLYTLLKRLRTQHPTVEIESCASGGARMDFGILHYTQRFWLSDCNDAHERQIMQQWAALFFPAEVLGSHIGPPESHTTSRVHQDDVRIGTAFFGHLGIEWDIRKLDDTAFARMERGIALHKAWRPLLHQGLRHTLNSGDDAQIAFSVSHKNRQLVSVFQQRMPTLAVGENLKLKRLVTGQIYRLQCLFEPQKTGHLMKQKPAWMDAQQAHFTGAELMQVGLPLPVLDPDTLLVLALEPMDP